MFVAEIETPQSKKSLKVFCSTRFPKYSTASDKRLFVYLIPSWKYTSRKSRPATLIIRASHTNRIGTSWWQREIHLQLLGRCTKRRVTTRTVAYRPAFSIRFTGFSTRLFLASPLSGPHDRPPMASRNEQLFPLFFVA